MTKSFASASVWSYLADTGGAIPAQIQRYRAQARANHLDTRPAAGAGATTLP